MITRLRVKNYLSLQDVDLELRPRTNVFVGPNMSGKSNLIDCFRFLSHMVSAGLNKAFLDRGGFAEVVWQGGDENRISFQVMAHVEEEPKKSYDYTITIVGSTTGLIAVEREHLAVKQGDQISTLIDLSNGQGHIMHLDGTKAFDPPGHGHSALEFTVPGWEGTDIKNSIASWRFYNLLPALMKRANVAVGQNFLSEDGGNFSSWLMTLQTNYPEEFQLVQQAALDVFPDLEAVLTPVTQFVTTVSSREKHLKRPIRLFRMSDGELSFLALLSLIFAPADLGSPLYCVEEPENHLHPRLLETLWELLAQRQNIFGPQAAQIIVTTHSPYLVDRMTLDDLVVIEKQHGATRYTRPASKGHLRELLEREELGLRDLWYAGSLGGNPC
jgi:predicted ATPase